MKKLPAWLIFGSLAMGASPAMAADFNYKIRSDWTVNKYGKDTWDCWNNGIAATCGHTPTQLEGETEARVTFDHELSDVWELRSQLGAEAYYNTGWTERSSRAVGPTAGRPRWVYHLMDTWVGLHHADWGTVRLGSGLNPFQQTSSQIDGNTDLGGREYLERMVAYDSPIFLGNRATGVKLQAALYDGARYRKVNNELAAEDETSAARAKGMAALLDGKIGGKVTARLGFYTERYGARKFYGTGPLDGIYTLAPGSTVASPNFNEENPALTNYQRGGAKARSRGVGMDLSYESNSYRIGAQLLRNQRLPVNDLVNPVFAQNGYGTGYTATGGALYFSTWHGDWSLWSKVSTSDVKLTAPQLLNTTSDWLYPNSTFRTTRASVEVSYAVTKHARLIVGGEWSKRDFKESPLGSGTCSSGAINPCYDPKGFKFFTGVRTNF